MNREQILSFEEMAANAHVSLSVILYDGWLLKFANGYTGRANSISVLYPSSKPLDEKLSYCEKCYASQNLPALFKLTDCDAELSDFLASRNYTAMNHSDVMTLSNLSAFTDSDNQPLEQDGCSFYETPEQWLPCYFDLKNMEHKDKETFREMLSKVLVKTVYCTIEHEGKTAACASGAIEHGYVLLQNVIVRPEFRRRGFGKKIISAVLSRASKMGAQNAYLQVFTENEAAVNLYTQLGFSKAYSYWYMEKKNP